MDTPQKILDLTVACVTSVKNATGMELDLTQDTLPILDHYAELLESPEDEIVSLLAPMCGAYFGELLQRELGEAQWDVGSEDHAEWRLRFDQGDLALNPVGLALEVLTGQEAPGWGAHLTMAPSVREEVERAMSVYGDVREDDYYRFSVRFEAVDQAFRAVANKPNNPGRMTPEA